jgi:hypothetical protein
MISCRARLVTMDETRLYHYDPEIQQQSMELRHSGSSRPKISKCKNPLVKFSPRFLGIKTASSPLIIFQKAKLSTRFIGHLLEQLKDILKKKRGGNFIRVNLFLHENALGSPDTCNREATGLPLLPVS